MSAQPRPPIPIRGPNRRREYLSDGLYLAGAALVVIGLALGNRYSHALEAAGGFVLLMPVLELASSFIRGLRYRR